MTAPPTRHVPIGGVLDEVAFTVEEGKIGEFARATRATDAVHTCRRTALDAGLTGIAATPTHVVVAGHHRNQAEFVAALGLAIERIVVGSVDWEYSRPLVVGDRLTGTRRVVDDTVRDGHRGGRMRLVTLETRWVDADGDVVVTQREVLIERGAK
ncbi:MaoC family dehydratase [Gordonia sp. TBRC 11910]|uniref:MaoC family dehydratase n=1 Tax=Gordonia asplenii TaxID=2725283 RepID=A0A848KVG0_9ACTN|nr:MaoC family dehydratase N-terminal domain-containing protein [Gordonia asplenii]NMO02259.1 MaoC family dehydratase [Gordonia asplenii]